VASVSSRAIPPVASSFSRTAEAAPAAAPPTPAAPPNLSPNLKDALLAEIRKSKVVFYNTVVAQAQKVEVAGDRVTFTFSPTQRALRDQFEQNRSWLETVAQQIAGRRVAVAAAQNDAPSPKPDAPTTDAATKKTALREQALADAGVQALLEVFPAEIRDVEEM
jgi:hypothetical protein